MEEVYLDLPVVVEEVKIDEEMEPCLWGEWVVEEGRHRTPYMKSRRDKSQSFIFS